MYSITSLNNYINIKVNKMTFICEICGSSTSTKSNMKKHKESDGCQRIKKDIEYSNNINAQNKTIKELSEHIDMIKSENVKLENKIKTFELEILNKDNEIENLKEKCEEYRKIVEKAAVKTNVKTNVKTYNRNQYLNYISSEPIKFSELNKQMENVINHNTLLYDDNVFHDHIYNKILKDDKGKDKVLCTDINRKNFSYKDENSGQLISDPELEKLRDKMKNGTNIAKIKSELIQKLIKKYEGTTTDPYDVFLEIMKRLNFGLPFVDHVAKKTYVKTKPDEHDTLNIEELTENNENEEHYEEKDTVIHIEEAIKKESNEINNENNKEELYYGVNWKNKDEVKNFFDKVDMTKIKDDENLLELLDKYIELYNIVE